MFEVIGIIVVGIIVIRIIVAAISSAKNTNQESSNLEATKIDDTVLSGPFYSDCSVLNDKDWKLATIKASVEYADSEAKRDINISEFKRQTYRQLSDKAIRNLIRNRLTPKEFGIIYHAFRLYDDFVNHEIEEGRMFQHSAVEANAMLERMNIVRGAFALMENGLGLT